MMRSGPLRKVDRCSPVLRDKLPSAEHFGLFGADCPVISTMTALVDVYCTR
jgi:hypothetical protein